MKKIIRTSILIYLIIQVLLWTGYKNPKEKDFYLDMPNIEWPITKKGYDSLIHKPDTTPYHGNWVDVEN